MTTQHDVLLIEGPLVGPASCWRAGDRQGSRLAVRPRWPQLTSDTRPPQQCWSLPYRYGSACFGSQP